MAQAFRLAAKHSEQGHFTWKQWAAELAVELRAAEEGGQADDGTRYYEHRLATLERVIARKGLTDREALSARKDAWADAYRHAPHGKPVELSNTADQANEQPSVIPGCSSRLNFSGQREFLPRISRIEPRGHAEFAMVASVSGWTN